MHGLQSTVIVLSFYFVYMTLHDPDHFNPKSAGHDGANCYDRHKLHNFPVYAFCQSTVSYKNLAIANRSRVSCINTNNNIVTLKSGLEVPQGH